MMLPSSSRFNNELRTGAQTIAAGRSTLDVVDRSLTEKGARRADDEQRDGCRREASLPG